MKAEIQKKKRASLIIFILHEIQQRIRSPEIRKRIAYFFFSRRYTEKSPSKEVYNLFKDGYLIIPQPLSKIDIENLIEALKGKQCIDRARPELGHFSYNTPPHVTHTADINNIVDIPEVIKFANNKDILTIVEEYLGSKPIIDNIKAWWSIPGFDVAEHEQFYHRDNDSIRFIKLFMYLTNVDDSNGPHTFIKGSHISNNFLDRRRFSDEEIEKNIKTTEKVVFKGPIGTCFLEDTYGIHKGSLPILNSRLIIQVRYSLMPTIFVNKYKTSNTKCKNYMKDTYINKYLLK